MPITSERDFLQASQLLSNGKLSDGARAKLEASIKAYESGQTLRGPQARAEKPIEQMRPLSSRPAESRLGDEAAAMRKLDPSRPPEYFPVQEKREPTTFDRILAWGSGVPVENFGYAKPSLADSMPNMIGGNVRFYEEPPRSMFEAEMTLKGIDPATLTDEDYQRYADDKWRDVYDQAQAEKRPVVRTSQMHDDSWAGQVGEAAMGGKLPIIRDLPLLGDKGLDVRLGLPQIVGAASGYIDSVGPGASKRISSLAGGKEALDTTRGLEENHRVANVAGRIGGAFNRFSLPGNIGKVASGAVGAGSALRSIAGGALGGALGGGVSAGLENAVNDAADADVGRDPQGPRQSVGLGIGLGGGLGALGGGIGHAATKYSDALREGPLGPAIRTLERAGGRLGLGGPKPPERVAGILDEAKGAEVHPLDVAADRVVPDIAKNAASRAAQQKLTMQQETQSAHRAMANQTVSSTPLVDRTLEILKGRQYSADGSPLPVAELEVFKKQLPRMMTAEAVDDAAADLATQAGGRVVSMAEARELGIPIKGLERPPILGPTGKPIPDTRVVVLKPREMTAPELDEIEEPITRFAGQTDTGGKPDPAWRKLSESVKSMRDEFVLGGEPGGYSALNRKQSELIRGAQQDYEHAGLPRSPKPYGELQAGEQTALANKVRGYGSRQPGRLNADRSLEELAPNEAPADPNAAADFVAQHPDGPGLARFITQERFVASQLEQGKGAELVANPVFGAARVRSAQQALDSANRVLNDAAKAGASHKGTVFRGMAVRPEQLAEYQPGATIKNQNIWSVADNSDDAAGYLRPMLKKAEPGSVPVLLEVRQGSAVPVSGLQRVEQQLGQGEIHVNSSEMLIPSGRQFKVLSSTQQDGVRRVVLEEVGAPGAVTPRDRLSDVATTRAYGELNEAARAGGAHAFVGAGGPRAWMSLSPGTRLKLDPALRGLGRIGPTVGTPGAQSVQSLDDWRKRRNAP